MLAVHSSRICQNQSKAKRNMSAECSNFGGPANTPAVTRFPDIGFVCDKAYVFMDTVKSTLHICCALWLSIQGEHKVFPWLQTFITRKLRGIKTYIYIYIFSKCNSTQEVCLQHISTLQHVLLLLHGERLIDNQFLSTCSLTCLQLL